MDKRPSLKSLVRERNIILRERIEPLLASVASPAILASTLPERRQAILKQLVELLGAQVGHWAWGYGDVVTNGLLPVAIVTEGYNPEQLALFHEMSLDTELMRPFRMAIYDLMGGNHHSTVVRSEIFRDQVWSKSNIRRSLQNIGFDEWIHSVRYQSANVWSNMMLLRKRESAPFDLQDATLLDMAMNAISWLHATAEEIIPKELLVGLTDRQRLIAAFILEGLSRKQIAARIYISEHTVGDHIKNIFKHFKVASATELAAIFLQGK